MLDNDERKKILFALIATVIISSGLLWYLSRPQSNSVEENIDRNISDLPVQVQDENGLPAGIKIPENVRPSMVNSGTNSSSGSNVSIPEQPQYGLPVRIKIPMIGVDAPVEYVGITETGEMGIPKGPAEVGWYELGTRPGEEGSAVVAGHYGTWRSGEGSVFDNLSKLRPDDKVYLEDNKGNTVAFIVRESRDFDPTADTTSIFTSNDGKAHLNLITCEGAWNKASQSFSQRRVVFTDKI